MAPKKPKSREPIESTWAGHAKYACPFCAFDALELARVREHIDQIHPIPAPPETTPATVTTEETATNG